MEALWMYIGYGVLFVGFLFFNAVYLIPFIFLLKIFQRITKYHYKYLPFYWIILFLYITILVFNAHTIFSPITKENDCNSIIKSLFFDGFSKESCLMNLQTDIQEKKSRALYDSIMVQWDPVRCNEIWNVDQCLSDLNRCELVSNDEVRSDCYFKVATFNQIVELCDKTTQKTECYISIAAKKLDIKICQKINNNNPKDIERCEYFAMLEKIPKEWKLEDCKFFENNSFSKNLKDIIPWCYAQVWACEKIENNSVLKDRCYWKLKLCDKVTEPSYKENCIKWEDMSSFWTQ